MALETRQVVIDGLTFNVSQLPARRSYTLLNRIMRALGPAFAAVMGAAGSGDLLGRDVGALGNAVQTLFASLTEAEQTAITEALLGPVELIENGRATPAWGQVDRVFTGNLLGLFKLIYAAFEVNYGDFLDFAKGRLAGAPKAPTLAANP